MKIKYTGYFSFCLALFVFFFSSLLPAAYSEGLSFSDTKIAAEKGDVDAQYNLGLMYDLGQGTPQNDKEALKWYRKAAEQGNANGQYNLGVMYFKGQGTPRNYGEALKWYRKAAEQGDADGQYDLGAMYSEGQGTPQNYVLAHMWFNLAAAGGRKEAVDSRDSVAKRMTAEQISEAQKMAREWKKK